MDTLPKPIAKKALPLFKGERKIYAEQDHEDGPIMLVRYDDWQARLVAYLQECVTERITCDWEFNHCAGFAVGAIEEMTGYDFTLPHDAEKVTGPKEALKVFHQSGYRSMEEFIETHFIEVPLVYAHRGDLALVKTAEFEGLGMAHAVGIAMPPVAYFLGKDGIGYVSLISCSRAFAVGSLG